MEQMRTKLKMMSVNQMAVYHTLLEAHNVMTNSASEQIKSKWVEKTEYNYSLRSETKNQLKVPEKPSKKCTGFTYNAPKLWNMLPCNIKETLNGATFKTLIKNWIWQQIPSY